MQTVLNGFLVTLASLPPASVVAAWLMGLI